jgi:hypothetical protein
MPKEDGSVRVTITIPKSLRDRAAAIVGRFNVSRACQEGLEMAVKMEETKTLKGDEISRLAARLKVEREALSKKEQAKGLEHGRKDAINFSIERFKVIERINEKLSDQISVENAIDTVLEMLELEFEEVFWGKGDEPITLNRGAYLLGYISGVMEVQDRVFVWDLLSG